MELKRKVDSYVSKLDVKNEKPEEKNDDCSMQNALVDASKEAYGKEKHTLKDIVEKHSDNMGALTR